jgi:hypothetical protein
MRGCFGLSLLAIGVRGALLNRRVSSGVKYVTPHLDHAQASTAHAFQGRIVDNVIAVMEARHSHLTTQKRFCVEVSRARRRADLAIDDTMALRETLGAATGERGSGRHSPTRRAGASKHYRS